MVFDHRSGITRGESLDERFSGFRLFCAGMDAGRIDRNFLNFRQRWLQNIRRVSESNISTHCDMCGSDEWIRNGDRPESGRLYQFPTIKP